MQARKLLAALIALGFFVVFAYAVWPTPWRVYRSGPDQWLFREHRFTGEVQMLTPAQGWRRR